MDYHKWYVRELERIKRRRGILLSPFPSLTTAERPKSVILMFIFSSNNKFSGYIFISLFSFIPSNLDDKHPVDASIPFLLRADE